MHACHGVVMHKVRQRPRISINIIAPDHPKLAGQGEMQGNEKGGNIRMRPEIQGLRAIAVAAVLLFHVWPAAIGGGYVGVDVFFVISGFLITSLLLRELEQDGSIGLGIFYLKRMRRLLPTATIVLAVIALMTPLLLPPTAWRDTALEVISSALYVENWRLAHLSMDYLGAENPASPVQHYWSLSVEEQFYLLWPALMAILAWGARRAGLPLPGCLRMALAIVIMLSLGASVWLTRADPAHAYFVTHTRIWELSLGGLLAVTPIPCRQWSRDLVGWVGLIGIALAVFAFDAATPFPGYAALVPTIGTALVIVAGGSGSRFSAYALLASPPFRWMGDASYSIYLWHWPIVVFFMAKAGDGAIGPVAGAIVIVATLGLASFSKVHVEDRFRHHGAGATSIHRPIRSIATGALVPVLLAGALLGVVAHEEAEAQRLRDRYPGAGVLARGGDPPTQGNDYVPSLAALKQDRAAAYDNGCHLRFKDSEPVACRYGDPQGKFKVFLIGDSHAANWIPALEEVAEQKGWNAFSYTKSSCPLMPVMLRRAGKPYGECLAWGRQVRRIIAEERPDLVILAQMHSGVRTWSAEGDKPPSPRKAMVGLWREIMAGGSRVVAVVDTPRWRDPSPESCLANDRKCRIRLQEIAASKPDPVIAARREEREVALLDFTDLVCPDGICPAVIGNVVVWRDSHHLTATYSRSMANFFAERLEKAMVGAAGVPNPERTEASVRP